MKEWINLNGTDQDCFTHPTFLLAVGISIIWREGIVVLYQMMTKCHQTTYVNSHFCFFKLL